MIFLFSMITLLAKADLSFAALSDDQKQTLISEIQQGDDSAIYQTTYQGLNLTKSDVAIPQLVEMIKHGNVAPLNDPDLNMRVPPVPPCCGSSGVPSAIPGAQGSGRGVAEGTFQEGSQRPEPYIPYSQNYHRRKHSR